jgi:hypothetical protein
MPANYTYKVELEGTTGFVLDTDLLDTGLLGYLLTDITSYVRSVSTRRGKSTNLGKFTAGQMTVTLDNSSRIFDPNYTSSPLFGAIVPRRRLIFSIQPTDSTVDIFFPQFTGYVDDWSFSYDVSGESIATASCSDAFTVLANQDVELTALSPELSGDRIQRVLRASSVAWREAYLQSGSTFTMGTATFSGNALEYMQNVAEAEFGYFFIQQDGSVQFIGWNSFTLEWPAFFKGLTFSDGSGGVDGIPFTNIETQYSAQELYNYVTVQSYAGTVVSQGFSSQTSFGIAAQEYDVPTSGTAQMKTLADYIVTNYGSPRFRVTGVTVSLDQQGLSDLEYDKLLSVDLGRDCRVNFTPNNVGTAVINYAWIIGKDINATPEKCDITFSLAGDEYRSVV